jgi:hypothetical protein
MPVWSKPAQQIGDATMKDSFGEALRSFSNSIDLLRDDEFARVLSSTRRYLETNFSISKIERLGEVVKAGVPHLAPTLSEDDAYDLYPVRTDDGKPFGVNAAAFTSGSNLWVVPSAAEPDATLDTAEEYEELWNPNEPITLPRFVRLPGPNGQPRPVRKVRALVSIPVTRRSITTSLIYFESDDVIHPSDAAKDELELVARAVARLYDLKVQNKETHSATSDELDVLDTASRVELDWEAVSSLFWAYPESGNDGVLAVLERTLQTAGAQDEFKLFDWKRNASGGRIPAEIEEQIRKAKYFVAYLSQPSSGADGPRYVDNPNVLYEAGVFQGLANLPTRSGHPWMLIREKDSPEAPFDITTFNTLVVPRDDRGELLERDFESEFKKRLDALLA